MRRGPVAALGSWEVFLGWIGETDSTLYYAGIVTMYEVLALIGAFCGISLVAREVAFGNG